MDIAHRQRTPKSVKIRWLTRSLPSHVSAALWCFAVSRSNDGWELERVEAAIREHVTAWQAYATQWASCPQAEQARLQAGVIHRWSNSVPGEQTALWVDSQTALYRMSERRLVSALSRAYRLRSKRRVR